MALTVQFLTGFEAGLVHADGASTGVTGGLAQVVFTPATCSVSAANPRTGTYCLRIQPGGGSWEAPNLPGFFSTKGIVFFAFRVVTLPTGNNAVLCSMEPSLTQNHLTIDSDGRLRMVWWNDTGGVDVASVAGPLVTADGLYHTAEMRVDRTAGTVDWWIDGTLQTQLTGGPTSGNLTNVFLGDNGVRGAGWQSAEVLFDDYLHGTWTAGTERFTDQEILGYVPGSDGAHSFTANDFSTGDAGTLRAPSYASFFDEVNNLPTSNTRSTTVNVTQRVARTTAYVELAPGATASGKPDATAARALVGFSSVGGAGSNLAGAIIRNGSGGNAAIWGDLPVAQGGAAGALQNYDVQTVNWKGVIVPNPGTWSKTNLDAVRWRIGGSSDVAPLPSWDFAIMEVAYPKAAGTTYTKSGQINPKVTTLGFSATSKEIASAGTIAPKASASGADVFESTETGSLQPKAKASGADVFEATEAGTIAPKTFASATDVATYARQAIFGPKALTSGASQHVITGTEFVKTGTLAPKVTMSGADAFATSETGTLAPKARASGADVLEATETGSIAPKAVSSGADVFETTESGTVSSKVLSSGVDVSTFSESGSLAPKAVVSGADVFETRETGSLVPKAAITGESTTLAGTTYAKTGTIASKVIASGSDTVEFRETGQVASKATSAASKLSHITRTGQVSAKASIDAMRVHEMSRTATLAAVVQIDAYREATWTRSGGVSIVATTSGASTHPGFNKTGTLATKPGINLPGKRLLLTIHEAPTMTLWLDTDAHLLSLCHEVKELGVEE